MKKSTIMRVNELEKFLYWLAENVLDEEYWELNADAYGELISRKLTKCGILKCVNGRYLFDRNYYPIAVELVAEKRRDSKK